MRAAKTWEEWQNTIDAVLPVAGALAALVTLLLLIPIA